MDSGLPSIILSTCPGDGSEKYSAVVPPLSPFSYYAQVTIKTNSRLLDGTDDNMMKTFIGITKLFRRNCRKRITYTKVLSTKEQQLSCDYCAVKVLKLRPV